MNKPADFQARLAQLEKIIARLEHAENSLEDNIADYEQGMRLVAACQQALAAAKQRVELVSKQSSGELLVEELTDQEEENRERG